jgi:hypothetical protein
MRICGLAAEGLRNERRIHETFPVKELQDYWSSRPRYEDVNPKSKEFRSGSLLSSNKSSDDVGGGEDPGGGGEGQTYQEWLALQREVKEEVPPPPYTLEGDESISTQTVTNPDIRPPIVATTAEVPLRNSPAVANAQPPVSLSHAAARPAVNTNTYPTSHAASSSHAVLSSSIPAASPPAININTYPTSASPASWQEAHSHVNAQPSYPPAQGHSPGSVHHHPQSVPPSQRHSPQPYPPGVSQHPQSHLPPSHSQHSPHAAPAVQSYPPHTGPQHHHQPYQAQTFQPYPPTSDQAPVWGQQPQPYPHSGDPSYQGYPTSTGHSQGYPSAGVPSQGYTSPVAQSYANSGSPVHHNQSQNSVAALGHDQPYPHSGDPSYQGYPTSIGHSQGYPSAGAPSQGYTSPVAQSYPNSGRSPVHHNQSQDSVAALGQEFGRQSISNPSGVSSGGRLPTPPPLHPSRPSRPIRLSSSSLKQTSSSGVSSGGKLPSPPPLHPAHPNYLTRPASSSLKPSSPNLPNQPQSQTGGHHHAAASPLVSSSSGQGTSTTNTATHRPRWPPAEWNSDIPPVRPPVQQFSGRRPSGHDHVGAALTRPQTVGASSSNLTGESTLRPTSSVRIRPSRPDTNMPPAAYGHSDDNANPFSFPEMYEQHVTFPPGPQYNTTYKTSGYPDQQGAMAYGSWPEPGRVSPPPTFPVSAMAYGVPGSSYSSGIESQYPGGPTFPSTTSAAGDVRMHFPEGPGGSYFDTSSSSLYRTPSTSGPPMQSRK